MSPSATTAAASAPSSTAPAVQSVTPQAPQPATADNPQPQPQSQVQQPSGPQVGDACIGANIGLTATDANGMAIVCDNYQWLPNVGQEPSHPWVGDQVAWMNCLDQQFTAEECREMTN